MDPPLIQLVNRLQDTFHNLGGELDMPQLVVVGSQSAGKSSVLETIVGKDFLPRGSGIVTRRPLVLQLIHTDEPSDGSAREWAQFLHLDKKYTDFEEVKKEIESETFRVAGQNKGISKLPISLRIYSPDVLDLTVVDLPGLTKIPVGDQPSDIERQIRNLVLDYIEKPNSVILSVSAANVDLANSESLKVARSVDPQMRRTLGVLTKLDLMDAGTNALDILTGRTYPLKLGFIGVVNRSQADINENRPLSYSLQKEEDFFKNTSAYRNISHKNGTRYLGKVLNQVLMAHIRDKLPDMKARLNTLMGQAQQELNGLGESAAGGDKNAQGALVLRLMTQFARDFTSSIDGTAISISTKELSGGARIYYIFNDVFGSALNSISPLQNLDDSDIRTAIRNSTGPRPSLFVPEIAFDLLVKPQIQLLEAPALRCVELVYEELVKICHGCSGNDELSRFPRLHSHLVEVVSELLRERLGPTSDYAQSLIKIQAAYINTNHPVFVAGSSGDGAAAFAHHHHSSSSTHHSYAPRKSADPLHSMLPASDADDDLSSSSSDIDADAPINAQLNGRSVSSTLHDRSRTTAGAQSTPSLAGTDKERTITVKSSRTSDVTHVNTRGGTSIRRPHSATGDRGQGGAGSSARETFLNYFFGANGPGPLPGDAGGGAGSVAGTPGPRGPIGRDTTGPSPGMNSGLMAGKRDVSRGGDAAFDMKSLGKHIEAVPSTDINPSLTPRDEMETSLIRSLIATYFNIVRQSIQDLIPKAIMHFLVNHTAELVQDRLVGALYKPELFGELLNEDEGLVAERTRVKALLEAYKDAFKTLSEVGLKAI